MQWYTSFLATISVVQNSWSLSTTRKNSSVLFVAFVVYVYCESRRPLAKVSSYIKMPLLIRVWIDLPGNWPDLAKYRHCYQPGKKELSHSAGMVTFYMSKKKHLTRKFRKKLTRTFLHWKTRNGWDSRQWQNANYGPTPERERPPVPGSWCELRELSSDAPEYLQWAHIWT